MTAASWRMALLGGALLRRRRRAALGLAAVGSLLVAQVGCGPETAMSEHTGSGTSESSTTTAMSTGDAPDEVSARMFGRFRYAHNTPGRAIMPPPDTMLFWHPWSTLLVERDGTLAVQSYSCQSTTYLQTFSWVHTGGDVLKVVPDKYNSDGTFRWKADDVLAVTLRPGPGCDGVEELIEYLPGSGKSPATVRYLPGEICTRDNTPEDTKDCSFTFVECDGAAPPACTAEGT